MEYAGIYILFFDDTVSNFGVIGFSSLRCSSLQRRCLGGLALLGFHIYRANGSFKNGQREGIVLICRGRLTDKQKVAYIKLDDRIFFVRGGQE